jgi:hypothetical protein
MLKLWKSVEAGDVGVSLIPFYKLTDNPGGANKEQTEWTKIPVAYQVINGYQAQKLASVNSSTFM